MKKRTKYLIWHLVFLAPPAWFAAHGIADLADRFEDNIIGVFIAAVLGSTWALALIFHEKINRIDFEKEKEAPNN